MMAADGLGSGNIPFDSGKRDWYLGGVSVAYLLAPGESSVESQRAVGS